MVTPIVNKFPCSLISCITEFKFLQKLCNFSSSLLLRVHIACLIINGNIKLFLALTGSIIQQLMEKMVIKVSYRIIDFNRTIQKIRIVSFHFFPLDIHFFPFDILSFHFFPFEFSPCFQYIAYIFDDIFLPYFPIHHSL